MTTMPITRTYERGTAAVEFALISLFFFTLLFGIVELGRMLYVWNTVQEVTRRAAREAVVQLFSVDGAGNSVDERDRLRNNAIFRALSTDVVYLPGSPEISSAVVRIRLLYEPNMISVIVNVPDDAAENLSICAANSDPASTDYTRCIRYVAAEVCAGGNDDQPCTGSVQYQPLIGFLLGAAGVDFAVNVPVSPVMMPAESLGYTQS